MHTRTFIKYYETIEPSAKEHFEALKGEWIMRGTPILIIFFFMFTAASLLAPFPMFPGNFICYKLGSTVYQYALYFSAVLNGLFYGAVVWAIFAGLSRKLEQGG